MIEPRFYRQNMGERFTSLTYRYKDSDIWVAFDRNSSNAKNDILYAIDVKVTSLWLEFEEYFKAVPEFKKSFDPFFTGKDAPEHVKRLSEASFVTGVGPMAGIAGLFSEEIGTYLKREFGFREIIVENGGDDFIDVIDDVKVNLFAGTHPLSNRIQLRIEAQECPLGLCASSGKFGHSTSLGKADLVSVACKDAVIADQFATAFANKINDESDIASVINNALKITQIKHMAIFKDRAFAIGGDLKVVEH